MLWIINHFVTVQLEELLEPYLKDTDLGLPYWDWSKNTTIPDLWEDIYSPINDYKHPDFESYKHWTNFNQCQNKFQGMYHRFLASE